MVVRAVVLIASLGFGCGRVGFEAQSIAADAAPDAPADAPPIARCPDSYNVTTPSSTSRYRLVTGTPVDWLGAAAACANDQVPGSSLYTHLVVFDTDTERADVNAAVPFTSRWIGASDLVTEGDFRWVTSESTTGYPPPTGAPWQVNQPDNLNGQHCVRMVMDGSIDDATCSDPYAYLCECDGFANDPTRYGM